MTTPESEVRDLLGTWSEAIRAKDLERLMALYAPDIVYFDVVPPLRYAGTDALRRDFARWLGGWQSPIGVEVRDLNILASDDVAVAFMLHRTSGTLRDGREVDYWVRATVCCRRSEHGWSIAHEHVSLPVDVASGRAATDLVP